MRNAKLIADIMIFYVYSIYKLQSVLRIYILWCKKYRSDRFLLEWFDAYLMLVLYVCIVLDTVHTNIKASKTCTTRKNIVSIECKFGSLVLYCCNRIPGRKRLRIGCFTLSCHFCTAVIEFLEERD